LKRFIVVEKPQLVDEENYSDKGGGDENAHPNSPSSRRSRPIIMDYEFQKNKAPVEIAERLSLANFLSTTSEACQTSSLGEYKIQSIVHHIGSRASSGHYTADALRPSKDLYSSDDDDKKEEEGNKDDADNDNTKNDDDSKKGNGEGQSLLSASAAVAADEEWISFDDTNSARNTFVNIAGSNFKQRTAYMLLYKFSPSTTTSASTTATEPPLQESCKVADDDNNSALPAVKPAAAAPMDLVD
jgi:Ubiquitin carboxyl-terminal hydrolase